MRFSLAFEEDGKTVYTVVDDDKKWGQSGFLSGNDKEWLTKILDEGPDASSVAAVRAILKKLGKETQIEKI